MILAVDFDGTLSLGEWPETGKPNRELIDFLKDRQRKGDRLILWTCREGKYLEDALKWCRAEELEFDAVNDNLPENILQYGGNSRKIGCDYYIDDRAVQAQAYRILDGGAA